MANVKPKALVDAWQQLEAVLMEANKHYLMYNDGGRTAAFRQLGAINQFLATVAPDPSLQRIPLLALYLALHYLDSGIVEPMLAPNASGRGRRPLHELLRIRSAVAMTQLHDIGYDRKEAAKRVVEVLSKVGFETTPRALADWRDNLKGLPEGDESSDNYRMLLGQENVSIGRGSKTGPVRDQKMKMRLCLQILDSLRKFVLLAHLTSSPNPSEALGKLKARPTP